MDKETSKGPARQALFAGAKCRPDGETEFGVCLESHGRWFVRDLAWAELLAAWLADALE